MITVVIMVILAVDLSEGGIIFTVISQLFTGFGIGLAQPTTGAIAFNTLNQVKREKYPPVSQTKVWKETEIQKMLLNQHLLDFRLNIVYSFLCKYRNMSTKVLFKIIKS